MKSLETISDEITILEAERDFGDITPEGLEQLAVLNLCYDLLCRTKTAQAILVRQPEEMKEPGFEDDFIPKFGVSWSAIADFAFNVTTKNGNIDMRKMLFDIIRPQTARDVAEGIGIRRQTIGDYFNRHKSMTCDNYEKIINFTLKNNS